MQPFIKGAIVLCMKTGLPTMERPTWPMEIAVYCLLVYNQAAETDLVLNVP